MGCALDGLGDTFEEVVVQDVVAFVVEELAGGKDCGKDNLVGLTVFEEQCLVMLEEVFEDLLPDFGWDDLGQVGDWRRHVVCRG